MMSTYKNVFMAVVSVAVLSAVTQSAAFAASNPRMVLSADSDWHFSLGDTSGAEAPNFVDQSWRIVNLPHDWSIEGKPQKDNPSAAGGGFFPTGVGWYRKSFVAPQDWVGRRVSVEFDGVYRNASVYLNGVKLITEPNGYTSFALDLSDKLKFGSQNTLAVRVDNSAQPNSRWYSGSGIYRHVRFVVTAPEHVAHWGVAVTTPQISEEGATVNVRATVINAGVGPADLTVSISIIDSKGNKVASGDTSESTKPSGEQEVSQSLMVRRPSLWSPEHPTLYRAITQIKRSGKIIDEVTTPFGIRSLSWSADKGLLLNGQSIKLTGGSVHHDNGALGSAAFDRAEERKAELLKAAGNNTVRTAHNIPSSAFLDACDRVGLLVLDEPFDTWEAHKVKYDYGSDFAANWQNDIRTMVQRDRNHPSIVIWGIGNEIPELTVSKGASLGKELAATLRALDSTRPLTLAFPGTTTQPTAEAVFSQLDITGYNYSLEKSYVKDHAALPNRLMLTTESFPAKLVELWEISTAQPYVLGDLTWTSMDYLGESGIGSWSYGTAKQAQTASLLMGSMMTTPIIDKMFTGMANGVDMDAIMAGQTKDPAAAAAMAIMVHSFPWHASDCGDLDLTGFRKPQSYRRDILWNGGDRVYATVRLPETEEKKIIAVGWATFPSLPSWTWQGQEGKPLQVEVYSGTEHVRLLLNGKVIGEQPTGKAQTFKATFSVPYIPGELKVVGLRQGKPVAEQTLHTTKPATQLRLTSDRVQIKADGQDLAFVTVEALDQNGQLVQDADQMISFTLKGPGSIAGVGSGDGQDADSYQASQRKLFHGRAQVIVRTSQKAGTLTLSATASSLSDGRVEAVARPDSTALPILR